MNQYRSAMPTVTLKAHFDGKHIVLDEPFEIPPNTRLAVTVLTATGGDDLDRATWAAAVAANLARAYGNEEPEYSAADLKQ
jgi:hypothetical protein